MRVIRRDDDDDLNLYWDTLTYLSIIRNTQRSMEGDPDIIINFIIGIIKDELIAIHFNRKLVQRCHFD